MAITRDQASEFNYALRAAATELAKKYGLVLASKGGASFSDSDVVIKMSFTDANQVASNDASEQADTGEYVASAREKAQLEMMVSMMAGKSVDEINAMPNFRYKLVGYNARARSAPVIGIHKENGKKFKIALERIKEMLK